MVRIVLICLAIGVSMAQEQDTVVKYFPTDIERRDILDGETEKPDVKGKSHFKSTYTGQGKLLNVEYVPGRKKGREKLSGLKLYYGYWDVEKRDLSDGLTMDQLDGRPFYEVSFSKSGRIKRVTYFDEYRRQLWSYVFRWNRDGTRSEYFIEFHVRESLTMYDEFLFTDDLSEIRPGWKAKIYEREDMRPQMAIIQDKLGQVYYYYTFKYLDGNKQNRSKEVIISEYFRDDSTKVGMHKLFFKKNDFLRKTEFYDKNDILLYVQSYDYVNAPKEIMLTTKDGKGKLLEKRLIPFSLKYKRKLGPPKDKTGLADIIKFIENTDDENLNKLTQLIEAKFDVSVESESPEGKEEPSSVETLKEQILTKETGQKQKMGSERDEKFALGVYLGNKLMSGVYLADDNVLEMGAVIHFPFKFNLFWFSISPSLQLGQVIFHGDDNSMMSWINLRSNDIIPLNFPIIMEGAIGTVGPGFGIKGGLKTQFNVGVDLTIGTSAVITNDINGKGQLTGYLSGELGVNYTLPF